MKSAVNIHLSECEPQSNIECGFDIPNFSRHQGLGKVNFVRPQLCQKGEAQLPGRVFLQDLLQGKGSVT